MSFLSPSVPSPPPPPRAPAPPPRKADTEARDARARAERDQRRRAGRQDTMLTGPTGLSPVDEGPRTILGV